MTQTPDPFLQPPADPPPGDQPPASRGRTIAIWILSVVAGLLVIAVIILLVTRGSGSASPTASPTVTPSPTASPTPTPSPTATAGVPLCGTGTLTLSLGPANGAAGSSIVPIVFTNKGAATCELHGFPGVSFVDANGTQIGAAAAEDPSVPITQIDIAPGGSAQAQLKIAEAANFSGCTVTPAAGLRVYPPHSYSSIVIPTTNLSGCAEKTINILTVQTVAAP